MRRRALPRFGVLAAVSWLLPAAPALAAPVREPLVEAEERSTVYVGPLDAALAMPLESLGLLALQSYQGFKDWKWGTASFRFNSEGWFGMGTGSGGMDKVGHAYANYMCSELLYWRLRSLNGGRWVISFYPALFTALLYQYVEFFDGFSVDHGYAYEDVIMNTAGVLASLVRNTFPAVRKVFDFRMQYFPSPAFKFRPLIDYEGQKFFVVLKLAAIPAIEHTPFRFVELLAGYHARGFSKDVEAREKREQILIGLGMSLEQSVFVPLEKAHGGPFTFMRLVPQYLQAPVYGGLEFSRREPR
jgi:hypothetical protein